jgi:ElaB/YqjD/DUF883 family membrane-anchored ribosome-binding protein
MSDNQIEGGAGPAIAAHSKDALASSSNAAPRTTGSEGSEGRSASATGSEAVNRLSGQAREAASQVGRRASQVSSQVRQRLLPAGTSDQVAEFVRDRPVAALFGAGVVGLVLGLFLGRRQTSEQPFN